MISNKIISESSSCLLVLFFLYFFAREESEVVHGPDQIFLPLQWRNSDMYQFKD